MLVMNVPPPLLKQLMNGLNGTVNDAKERLCYCAEMKIRLEVQLFEPLPSQLAYPTIILQNKPDDGNNNNNSSSGSNVTPNPSITTSAVTAKDDEVDHYQTWYPPLKHTLSLLSKLYGEMHYTSDGDDEDDNDEDDDDDDIEGNDVLIYLYHIQSRIL